MVWTIRAMGMQKKVGSARTRVCRGGGCYRSGMLVAPERKPNSNWLKYKKEFIGSCNYKLQRDCFRHGWTQELRWCLQEAVSLHLWALFFRLLLHSQAGLHFVVTGWLSSMYTLYWVSKIGRENFFFPQPCQQKSWSASHCPETGWVPVLAPITEVRGKGWRGPISIQTTYTWVREMGQGGQKVQTSS